VDYPISSRKPDNYWGCYKTEACDFRNKLGIQNFKAGILPDNSLTDALDIDSTAAEMQQYIDMLEINEPLLTAEFITIDNEIPIEHLDDDEILATVQENGEDDEKAVEPQPNISLKLALESADNLLQFIGNPPKELLFDPKTVSILRLLRSKIFRYQIDTLRQSQIDRFITITS